MDIEKMLSYLEHLKETGKITLYRRLPGTTTILYSATPDYTVDWGQLNKAWTYSGEIKLENGTITVNEKADLITKTGEIDSHMYNVTYSLTTDGQNIQLIDWDGIEYLKEALQTGEKVKAEELITWCKQISSPDADRQGVSAHTEMPQKPQSVLDHASKQISWPDAYKQGLIDADYIRTHVTEMYPGSNEGMIEVLEMYKNGEITEVTDVDLPELEYLGLLDIAKLPQKPQSILNAASIQGCANIVTSQELKRTADLLGRFAFPDPEQEGADK